MIKILDTNKTLDVLANDHTNGLGIIQPISATVEEELNGIYELTFQTTIDENRYNELRIGGVVSCVAGEKEGTQMFRINRIVKNKNGVVDIYCKHITYDLNTILVKPFSSTGAIATKDGILENVVGNYPFTMTTNIENTTSTFTLDIPKSFRECLGGWEGSILDTFRCEYEFDNLTVRMNASRGSDTNVRIAYGKNLVDLQQEENIEETYNAIVGYAKGINDETIMGDIQYLVETHHPRVKIVDFSSNFSESDLPTVERLNELALNYAVLNKINVPKVSLDVSFIQLSQTEEYKDIAQLERVGLGDRVKIFFPKLNVDASARVVKRVWNVVLNRYDTLTLGDTKANLTTAISSSISGSISQQQDAAKDFFTAEIEQISNLIINGLGLHKSVIRVDGGGYKYYLHNKQDLESSDTQFTYTSDGFKVSTDYGQTWSSGFDSQGDVVINALSTIILRALKVYGSYLENPTILFGQSDGTNIGVSTKNNGVSFDGTGPMVVDTLNNINLNTYKGNYLSNGLELDTNDLGFNLNIINRDANVDLDANSLLLQNDNSNSLAEINQLNLDGELTNSISQYFNKVDGTSTLSINSNYKTVSSVRTPHSTVIFSGDDISITAEDGDVYINGNKLIFVDGYVRY